MQKVNISKMKQVGLIRSIDELGRVVIPMEFRQTMGIEKQDRLAQNLCVDENGDYVVIIRKIKED